MRTTRQMAIMAAIQPYTVVANFNVADVFAATEKVVPDVDPEEISAAFLALAEDAEADLAELNAELTRHGVRP